jgi:sec-independent protein translocase protein TatB
MFDIGFWEILLITVVALVVVGPERLPKMIRVIGLWVGRAQASFTSIKREISKELNEHELQEELKKIDDLPNLNETIHVEDTKVNTPSDKNNG